MKKLDLLVVALMALASVVGAIGCNGEEEATLTPTPMLSPTPTATPAETATVTPTPIVSPIPAPQRRVDFSDVGQGDASHLDLEETEVLIDGGGTSSGVDE